MAKKRSSGSRSAACSCNSSHFMWLILGVIAKALGLFGLVQGFLIQWNGGDWLLSVLWYAGGILVMLVGKMWKIKGCGSCAVHRTCH